MLVKLLVTFAVDHHTILILLALAFAIFRTFFLNKKRSFKPLTDFSANKDIEDYANFKMKDLDEIPKKVDVVIVGAGIGGLSAGAVLAKAGYQVLVLEQHDRFGGATHCFELSNKNDDGEYITCGFDSGYHYTTGDFADPLSRTGQFLQYLNGGYCKWNHLGDPYDRVMFPGKPEVRKTEFHFVKEFPNLNKKIVEQISDHPETKTYLTKRMDIFFKMVREATSSTGNRFASESFDMPQQLRDLLEPHVRKNFDIYGPLSTAYVLKALFGCNYSQEEIKSAKPLPRGIKAAVDGKFELHASLHKTDPNLHATLQKLQALLVHPIGDYAVQPKESSFVTHALVVNYYEHGSSYPSSSPQDMSLGMVREILRNGGAVVSCANVRSLILAQNKVLGVRVGKKNIPIQADRVINAAGVWVLHNNLLPQDHPEVLKFRKQTTKKDGFQPSMGHFYTFLTLKGSPEELNLNQTNLWCLDDQGKGDIDGCYDKFFEDPSENDVPATYITFPCAKESHWNSRYKGISNCILFCDAPYKWFECWKDSKHTTRPDDYVEFKNMLEEKLLKVFYEKCPELKEKVVWIESATPLSSEHYLAAFRGADYGTRVDINYYTPEAFKYLMTPTTQFENLFQAGQDAMTPSIGGAMHGGILCGLRMITFAQKMAFFRDILKGQFALTPSKADILTRLHLTLQDWL